MDCQGIDPPKDKTLHTSEKPIGDRAEKAPVTSAACYEKWLQTSYPDLLRGARRRVLKGRDSYANSGARLTRFEGPGNGQVHRSCGDEVKLCADIRAYHAKNAEELVTFDRQRNEER